MERRASRIPEIRARAKCGHAKTHGGDQTAQGLANAWAVIHLKDHGVIRVHDTVLAWLGRVQPKVAPVPSADSANGRP
jgi:hypothetical protein